MLSEGGVMRSGKIKFFNAKNKFGFITEDGTGQEYYVHVKELSEPVGEGDEVTFEVVNRKKGPVATQVKKRGKDNGGNTGK